MENSGMAILTSVRGLGRQKLVLRGNCFQLRAILLVTPRGAKYQPLIVVLCCHQSTVTVALTVTRHLQWDQSGNEAFVEKQKLARLYMFNRIF
jgi:hypothetical protein